MNAHHDEPWYSDANYESAGGAELASFSQSQVSQSSSFASRSARELPWDSAQRSMAGQPGPGAYRVQESAARRPKPSAAFASSTERFATAERAGSELGFEVSSMDSERPGSARASAVFSSGTPRFEQDSRVSADFGQVRC